MGAPSMAMLVLHKQGKIKADYCVTADTGSENDMLLSNGDRATADEYYNEVIKPYCKKIGVKSSFPRAKDKNGNPLDSIWDNLQSGSTSGVPLFGSGGGRLMQTCTGKYKIRAVRQFLRTEKVRKAVIYLGLTKDEAHRMKPSDVKWAQNEWPLINEYKGRIDCIKMVENEGLVYPIHTQCDNCPHKDYKRWTTTSDWVIEKLSEIETKLPGQFFTPIRKPIKQAIADMKELDKQGTLFGDFCESGYCFT